jgi:tol-pal system protein YbgF
MPYLLLFFSLFIFTSGQSLAFGDNSQDRIDRLEKDLNMLQQQVYKGGASSSSGGGMFSKKESKGGGTSSVEVQLTDLEEQIRSLKGKLEENEFTVNNIAKKLDKIIADMDFRITAMEKKLNEGGGKPTDLGAITPPVAPHSDSEDKKAEPAAKAEEGGESEPVISGTAQEQYDEALKFLRKSEYDKAESALKAFIAGNKDSDLLSNAYYWLGESYYARENYESAAVNFLKGYQGWQKGNKAADNLVKLAMSLDKLKKKKEACTTFDKVLKEFPDAEASVKDKVATEKKRLSCG